MNDAKRSLAMMAFCVIVAQLAFASESRWWPILNVPTKQTIGFVTRLDVPGQAKDIVVTLRQVGDLSHGTCKFTTEYEAVFSSQPVAPLTAPKDGSKAISITETPPEGLTPPEAATGPYLRFKADALAHGKYVVLFRSGSGTNSPLCQTAQFGELPPPTIAAVSR